jgi:hypothetical protein
MGRNTARQLESRQGREGGPQFLFASCVVSDRIIINDTNQTNKKRGDAISPDRTVRDELPIVPGLYAADQRLPWLPGRGRPETEDPRVVPHQNL